MTQTTSTAYDLDPELHGLVDGQLGPAEAAAAEERLERDPELRARVEAWARHRDLIREAADAMEPGTVNLKTSVLERELARQLSRRSWQSRLTGVGMRRVAAGIALFVAGWGAHGLTGSGGVSLPYPGYVAEGIGAHQVFAYDAMRPVEFTPEASEVALDWISAKLQRKVSDPTLDALGLTLVGSRLQGTREGPLAQFIYEDAAGNRFSLIMAPHPEGTPAEALKYASAGDERVGYWSDAAFDYAITARASDAEIEAMMREVSLVMAASSL